MGETTFMKINGKHTAREKVSVNKERYKTDPKFERSRESNSDFTVASKTGAILRAAIRSIKLWGKDAKGPRLLHKELRKVLASDSINTAGNACIKDGDLGILVGFSFNPKSRLRAALNLGYTSEINKETGIITLNIPSFIPESAMKVPDGATHYRFVSAGISINFKMNPPVVTLKIMQGLVMPHDGNETTAFTTVHEVSDDPQCSYFLVLGLQFFKVAGKWQDQVKNGTADCLTIIAATN